MSQSGQQGHIEAFPLPHQGRSVAAIASLYLFRMLGLFMVLPVLTLYGQDYLGSTPLLLGLALGAYGFSQAILQIPFGWWSDRWGRKPVIAIGLLLFALGSVVAAMSESVYGLIAGRFLQGCGAIASALMALVADATSESNRSKAMAVIGISIGLSFSVALILGPMVTRIGGLSGIFWLTTGLAMVGLAVLYYWVPNVTLETPVRSSDASLIRTVLRDKELLRLDWGILVLHLILMANFVVIPRLLESVVGIHRDQHWWVYLPIVVGAFIVMMPLMLMGEKRGKLKPVFLGAVATLLAMEWVLALGASNAWLLLGALFIFFVAFNLLEATLPSQVSKMTPLGSRGTASGLYSSSQFLGAFLGGTLGGFALSWGGATAVFAINGLALLTWLIVAWPMSMQRQTEIPVTEYPKAVDVHSLETEELESV